MPSLLAYCALEQHCCHPARHTVNIIFAIVAIIAKKPDSNPDADVHPAKPFKVIIKKKTATQRCEHP